MLSWKAFRRSDLTTNDGHDRSMCLLWGHGGWGARSGTSPLGANPKAVCPDFLGPKLQPSGTDDGFLLESNET